MLGEELRTNLNIGYLCGFYENQSILSAELKMVSAFLRSMGKDETAVEGKLRLPFSI